VFVEAVRYFFSSQSQTVPPPSIFGGITNLGFMIYPTYRLAVVGICAVVMVDSLGINVQRIFMIVFGIGAMAAGFSGIVNAPVVSLTPEVGEMILVQT